MNVDDFIALQQQFVAETGFGEYLPTLWVETPRQVKVNILMDPPEGDELEVVARDWARQLARKHDYCMAFKADDWHLKIVARVGAVTREQMVAVEVG